MLSYFYYYFLSIHPPEHFKKKYEVDEVFYVDEVCSLLIKNTHVPADVHAEGRWVMLVQFFLFRLPMYFKRKVLQFC